MEWSGNIKELAAALVKFNEEVTNPVKDKTAEVTYDTGGYKYGFSDLASLTEIVRPILAKNGLSVIQELLSEPNKTGARTILLHSSGQFIKFDPVYIMHSTRPQEVGSAATYARRYSLLAALSIAPDDDDDGAAAQHGVERDGRNEQPGKAHPSVIKLIRSMRTELHIDDETYFKQLEHYGVDNDEELTTKQAIELKRAYEKRLKEK